ncbi:MAG: phosphatidylglycerol lysyltransferase domain-containing protein [Lachnospiraceae bacterium]
MNELTFKKPTIEDKELLDSYFKRYPSRSCDRTFANVFLWARHYHVEYAIIENAIVFKNEEEGELAFAYPVGEAEDVKKSIEVLEAYSVERNKPFRLYGITKKQYEQLEQWYPDEYEMEYNRDLADYVYESEKLATLSGKKLHGKRNHINQFKLMFEDWDYESFNQDNIEECFQMALQWRNDNGCDADEEKNAEMCVTLNSLRLYEELGLVGGLLRVNGKIVAFSIGEPICEDTFVVHIEKAFADVPGAYPMINQQFVLNECINYPYVNREEDTGAEGLRKAKLSYKPIFLIEKGIATKK